MIRVVVVENNEDIAAADYELDVVKVGSRKGIDLQIEGTAPHHAEIILNGSVCSVRPVGNNSYSINGRQVSEADEIQNTDLVTIGEITLRISGDADGIPHGLEVVDTSARPQARSVGISEDAGHLKLGSTQSILDFSSAETAAKIVSQARAILLKQGATADRLRELDQKGAKFGQQIIEEHKDSVRLAKAKDRAKKRKKGISARLTKAAVADRRTGKEMLSDAEKARQRKRKIATIVATLVFLVASYFAYGRIALLMKAFTE